MKGRLWVAFAAWLLVFTAGSLRAADPVEPNEFDVTLQVDFGPAGKPFIERTVRVAQGTTPEQLLAKICQVKRGLVCCDSRETAGIDGVMSHPGKRLWWSVAVNGRKKEVSPFQTRLKPDDVVRWEYRKDPL